MGDNSLKVLALRGIALLRGCIANGGFFSYRPKLIKMNFATVKLPFCRNNVTTQYLEVQTIHLILIFLFLFVIGKFLVFFIYFFTLTNERISSE